VGGDIGTDGMGIFRIKNSYAYFNLDDLVKSRISVTP